MLLVNPNETFTIEITYRRKGELVELVDKPMDGCETDKFEFRYPNWGDSRNIINSGTVGGRLEPMALTEAKIRVLLKSWSLKQGEEPVPLSELPLLPPIVIKHLANKIDEVLGPEGLLG